MEKEKKKMTKKRLWAHLEGAGRMERFKSYVFPIMPESPIHAEMGCSWHHSQPANYYFAPLHLYVVNHLDWMGHTTVTANKKSNIKCNTKYSLSAFIRSSLMMYWFILLCQTVINYSSDKHQLMLCKLEVHTGN